MFFTMGYTVPPLRAVLDGITGARKRFDGQSFKAPEVPKKEPKVKKAAAADEHEHESDSDSDVKSVKGHATKGQAKKKAAPKKAAKKSAAKKKK